MTGVGVLGELSVLKVGGLEMKLVVNIDIPARMLFGVEVGGLLVLKLVVYMLNYCRWLVSKHYCT